MKMNCNPGFGLAFRQSDPCRRACFPEKMPACLCSADYRQAHPGALSRLRIPNLEVPPALSPKLPPKPPHPKSKHHAPQQGELQHLLPQDLHPGSLEQDGVAHLGEVEER